MNRIYSCGPKLNWSAQLLKCRISRILVTLKLAELCVTPMSLCLPNETTTYTNWISDRAEVIDINLFGV